MLSALPTPEPAFRPNCGRAFSSAFSVPMKHARVPKVMAAAQDWAWRFRDGSPRRIKGAWNSSDRIPPGAPSRPICQPILARPNLRVNPVFISELLACNFLLYMRAGLAEESRFMKSHRILALSWLL